MASDDVKLDRGQSLFFFFLRRFIKVVIFLFIIFTCTLWFFTSDHLTETSDTVIEGGKTLVLLPLPLSE